MNRYYNGEYKLSFNDTELQLLKRGLNKVIAQDKEFVAVADGDAGTQAAAKSLLQELDLLNKLKGATKQ